MALAHRRHCIWQKSGEFWALARTGYANRAVTPDRWAGNARGRRYSIGWMPASIAAHASSSWHDDDPCVVQIIGHLPQRLRQPLALGGDVFVSVSPTEKQPDGRAASAGE